MLFEKIQEGIWGLSVSAGTAPYTFLSFRVDDRLRNSIEVYDLAGYTQVIAFFLWEDYTLEDYRDYIALSKQYLVITDCRQREQYLQQQMARHKEHDHFLQWQHNQIYIALGLAISEIRGAGIEYREVEPKNIDYFKQSVHIKCGILKELILF